MGKYNFKAFVGDDLINIKRGYGWIRSLIIKNTKAGVKFLFHRKIYPMK